MAITPDSYTTTSTGQVSGGGEKSVISGTPQPTASSQALQPSINAKQAQIDQFVKDNPSNFARSKQGLPPLSLQENAERTAQFRKLSEEKTALKNQQFDAQNPGLTTIIEKPNTTTNRNTTTFSTSSVDNDVEAPDSQDELLSQQEEERLDAQPGLVTGGNSRTRTVQVNTQGQIVAGSLQDTTTPSVSTAAPPLAVSTAAPPLAEPVDTRTPAAAQSPYALQQAQQNEQIATADAAPADSGLLTPAQSIARAQTTAPAPVDTGEVTGEDPNQSAAETARLARAENDAAASQAATEQRLREQQAIQAQFQSPANGDWRVKLKLPPQATYLYKDTDNILMQPLAASDGVVFPYMPEIQTTYNANYDTTDLTHSNYRGYFYRNSYVGDIGITAVFTAQNTQEANYLLAVIHFFRSATKMFYGEKDDQRGTPPPLVYLFGLGQYQFQAHPCVIRSFNYNLPNDVDYIRTKPNNYNVNFNNTLPKTQSGGNPISSVFNRLRNALLPKGAIPNVPQELLTVSQSVSNLDNSTYVPTKITMQINLLPMQTRNQQSQQFSVKEFASGNLLKGGFW